MVYRDVKGPYEPSYHVDEFCQAERISKVALYEMWKLGIGPRYYQSGRRRIITHKARCDWQREREAAAASAQPLSTRGAQQQTARSPQTGEPGLAGELLMSESCLGSLPPNSNLLLRSRRRLRQAAHLAKCGGRPVLEALLAVECGQPVDAVLADFARLPPELFHAVLYRFGALADEVAP